MESLTLIQKMAVWALPVIFAITVHEVAHGWVANLLGDPTAKRLGRLTLNPIKHIDPIGTILVPGVLIALSGMVFGWAKAIPVTASNLRNPKTDMAWVAIAGPASNLLMAIAWALIAKVGMMLMHSMPDVATFMIYSGMAGISINLILLILNLIPLPPLDGSRVATVFMSKKLAYQYNRLEAIGFILLLVLLLTGILSPILMVPYQEFFALLVNTFGLK